MTLGNQVFCARDPARIGASGPSGERSGRWIARRRIVLPATWFVSVVLAIALTAHGAATGAAWNALQLAGLVLLFAAPWAVAWLWSSAPAGSAAGVDALEAVDSDWLALVARWTGYSVTINDAQRRLVWVNDSFTRLTGYTAEEAIGRHFSELVY